MAAIKALIRYLSYLFHGLLALFLLAVSGLSLASGHANLRMGVLPWTGATLSYVLLFASLFGLVSLLLVIRGTLTWLFFLWTLAVTFFLIRGYIFSGYRFAAGEASTAGYLLLASLISIAGAWWAMRAGSGRKRRY